MCQQLYELIRNFKKEDGGLLCDSFIRAPKRRQEPGYYDVVSNPIDMLRIQQKLKTDEYEDPDELTTDIDLMISNAKAFYKKSSQEYKDACELWEVFLANKTRYALFLWQSPARFFSIWLYLLSSKRLLPVSFNALKIIC